MDALDLLIEDHRRIEELFAEFERSGDSAYKTKQRLASQIIRELSVHAVIEEQYLYPALRDAFRGSVSLAEESIDEHQAAEQMMRTLEHLSPQDSRFDELMEELIADVRHHVSEEEQEIFPELRKALRPERLRSMGRALQAAKATAPTRPHPNAPHSPPLNYVVGPVAAAADRIRDAVRDVAMR